jgi:hypothetical protein
LTAFLTQSPNWVAVILSSDGSGQYSRPFHFQGLADRGLAWFDMATHLVVVALAIVRERTGIHTQYRHVKFILDVSSDCSIAQTHWSYNFSIWEQP